MLLLIIGLIIHVISIYVGAQFAQIEYADIWRCVSVAIVSYVFMLLIGFLTLPLHLIPFMGVLVSAGVLLVGTAAAARVVLSVDWKLAWTVGIVVAIIHAIFNAIFH